MDFTEYQADAARTAIYPRDQAIVYPALGLASEAGEVAGKVKKVLRDKGGDFTDLATREAIAAELGDVLWYLAVLARDLGFSLDQLAFGNVAKLRARQILGTLGGDGDHR